MWGRGSAVSYLEDDALCPPTGETALFPWGGRLDGDVCCLVETWFRLLCIALLRLSEGVDEEFITLEERVDDDSGTGIAVRPT